MYLPKILNITQGVKHLVCSSVFTIACVGIFVDFLLELGFVCEINCQITVTRNVLLFKLF